MTATHDDITMWLEMAKEKEATHLIIAHDTFDHDNYPVFAFSKKECQEQVSKRQGQNMQRIDEVYNMSMDIASQRAGFRAMNI